MKIFQEYPYVVRVPFDAVATRHRHPTSEETSLRPEVAAWLLERCTDGPDGNVGWGTNLEEDEVVFYFKEDTHVLETKLRWG